MRSTAAGSISAAAGREMPTQPRSRAVSTSAGSGSGPASGTAPQPPNSGGSASMPWWWASISAADSSAGSVSIPSAVESATSARSNPSSSEVRAAQLGVGGVEGEDAVGLGGDLEGPAVAAADQHRRLGAAREGLDQRLAEQVLVDVDGGDAARLRPLVQPLLSALPIHC